MNLSYDAEKLAALCRQYHVVRLEVFGSHARGDARPDSDVDVLVTFEAGQTPGLEFFALADGLEQILGHAVDLLTRSRVERDHNEIFRRRVLESTKLLYAA